MATPSNWKEIAPSQFPWEREALDFIRQQFPSHEPYRAWSNFEFIAHDGSINEVDLLVVTPMGFFLVEIKGRPGQIRGDMMHWCWHQEDGGIFTDDNPLPLANRKAKKLASLLKDQKSAFGDKVSCPFLEALVFASHPDQSLHLDGTVRFRVCLRDVKKEGDKPGRAGVVAALVNRDCPGLKQDVQRINSPTARAISRALDQLGIRPSQHARQVSDYLLTSMVFECPDGTYQDWEAEHVSQKGFRRRVRIYNVGSRTSQEERDLVRKAAKREAELLERLQHGGILRCDHVTDCELGPVLVYRHDPSALRLDHYLRQCSGQLAIDTKLSLIRQIAEALKYAHAKGVIHRALSPQSILVVNPTSDDPRTQLLNWQAGRRFLSTSATGRTRDTITLHPDQLVDDASLLYMAPETLEEASSSGAWMDVFSLGAIAFHVLTGRPPASSVPELKQTLVEHKGLDIAAAMDGAGQQLQDLIRYSTHPEVADRMESVDEFLEHLESVIEELTEPEEEAIENPLNADRGDRLKGGFTVKKRLGMGGSAVALLVDHKDQEVVLKLANKPENNERLRMEFETLSSLHHQYLVEAHELVEVSGLTGFTMQVAGEETLAQRLRAEGPLQPEFLQRFGEDLLETVKYLEEHGVYHRDIKPDNLGIGPTTSKGKLHLLLFDFSLSKTPLENTRAGTPPYRDPFLSQRDQKPPRFDPYAERFAAAVTLYEMATGRTPQWGDGESAPDVLACEVTLHPELFEPDLRSRMQTFLAKALRRSYRERHDNAEQMLKDWREIFAQVGKPAPVTAHEEVSQEDAIAAAGLATKLAALGLNTRLRSAVDRLNAITVEDLLRVPLRRLQRLRGLGRTTRREIADLARKLHRRFPEIEEKEPSTDQGTEPVLPEYASVDRLVREVCTVGATQDVAHRVLQVYLGLTPSPGLSTWPSQPDVAKQLELSQGKVWEILDQARGRWNRMPVVTKLGNDIATILERFGGVMGLPDLAAAVLAARGSVQTEPVRSLYASSMVRAITEAERGKETPRFEDRRHGNAALIARSQELGDYAAKLGQAADELAAMDPLASSARAVEVLRAVSLPADAAPILSNNDLLKLAVYTSTCAALSARMEVYPRQMPSVRALRLAQGALCGVRELTVEGIQQRVRGRYPEAEPMPDRPDLDAQLKAIGLELVWSETGANGKGAYHFPHTEVFTLSSSGSSTSRASTGPAGADVSPEEIDVRLFQRKLDHANKEGAFLVLSVSPRRFASAQQALCTRFDLDCRSLDEVLIGAMKDVAQNRVKWDVVLRADAAPRDSRDWKNLHSLLSRCVSTISERLASPDRTILLLFPGLLARYGQMRLLEQLRDQIGTAGSKLHGLWVLIPDDGQHARPMIEGQAVPILSTDQYARVPCRWLNG